MIALSFNLVCAYTLMTIRKLARLHIRCMAGNGTIVDVVGISISICVRTRRVASFK